MLADDWTSHPQVARAACEFAATKLATCFPATVPAVRGTDVAGQLLARFNDLAVQVFTVVLSLPPEAHLSPPKRGGARGHTAAAAPAPTPADSSAAAMDALVTACASSSNAYACFAARAGSAASAAALGVADPSTQAQTAPPRWLEALLGYCRGVLLEGVAVGALTGVAGATESITASAASFSTALHGLQAAEPWVRSPNFRSAHT